MDKPAIHLWAIAGPCRALRDRLKVRTYGQIIALAQSAVGDAYRVTGRTELMSPWFDPLRGGRRDDDRRCKDIQGALADDNTRAIVTLRGGAWLTRLLPHVDFEVLAKRRQMLHVFGFSELTTIVNIAARFRMVRAYYHHDLGHLQARDGDYRAAFAAFLGDVVNIVEGRPGAAVVTGRLVRGRLRDSQTVRVVGGCLSVMLGLYGSRFQSAIDTSGRWLAIEDVHDDPYGIDRHLAQLKLAGAFERCRGLLIGDFHAEFGENEREEQTEAVLALLKYHLPARRRFPIVAHCNFGHCHPAAAMLLNRPLQLVGPSRKGGRDVRLALPPGPAKIESTGRS